MSNSSSNWPPPFGMSDPVLGSHSKDKVSYFYQNEVGCFHYGEGHPMKPARLALTHNLVVGYGMHKKMNVYSPRMATDEELCQFHLDDYVHFLKRVTPDNYNNFSKHLNRFNMAVDDCPVFDGLYDFVRLYSGSSLEAARKINTGLSDICVNWSGGLHHAKKFEASGFCYVNDIVLAALELLRYFPRVLYIDIDVHHGDGVQEAFLLSNRVMTVSFHRYDGEFFPRTGALHEIGMKDGKFHSINVPLGKNIDDDSYLLIFKQVMSMVMESFRPGAIILQCGADSLAGDRLGEFNLSIKGHGECVRFMKAFKVPLIVLGGGGYTIRNVARCWTYETSVLTGTDLPEDLPYNDYWSHFNPDYKLHPDLVDHSAENENSRSYLESIRTRIAEYLRYLQGAPSVQMQEIPPTLASFIKEQDDLVDEREDMTPEERQDGPTADGRFVRRGNQRAVQDDGEFYEGEEDQDQN